MSIAMKNGEPHREKKQISPSHNIFVILQETLVYNKPFYKIRN